MRFLFGISIFIISTTPAMQKNKILPEKEKAVQAVCNYYLRSHASQEVSYQLSQSSRWQSLMYESLGRAPFSKVPLSNLCNIDYDGNRYLVETSTSEVLRVYPLAVQVDEQ